MSAGSRRCLPCLLLSVPLGLLLAVPVAGQGVGSEKEGGSLAAAKARMEVEAQRVEKRFKDDREAAYRMVRSDPPRTVDAVEKMYTVLAMLRADTSLTAARREVLLVTAKWDVDNLKRVAAERRAGVSREGALAREAAKDARVDARRNYEDRRAAIGGGSDKERVREVGSTIGSRGKALADARDLRKQAAERRLGVMASIEKSALPPIGDIEFPANWVELSKRRMKYLDKMTAKEKAIMRALRSTVDVDFQKTSLSDAIEDLEKKTGIPITIEKKAMEDVNVTYETTINLKLKATTRTVLKKMLADLNLTYVIKDERIHITTPERAREMVTIRRYYVGDLLGVVDQRLGPIVTQLQMTQAVASLMDTIVRTIEPQSWKVNNPDAPGEISFDPITMSIVVKQTAELHLALGGLR
jgi:hypothetical protein